MVTRQPDRMWQPGFRPRDGGLWDLRLVHSTWRDRLHGRVGARERSTHQHDVYHVVPIVTGTGTFVAPEGPVAVAAPYLFLIAPGQAHSFTGGPGEDSVYSELTFAGESAPGVPLRVPWSTLLAAWFQGPCPVSVHGPVPAACVVAIDRAIADVTTLGHARHPQAEGFARATIHQVLAVIWRHLVALPAEPEDPAVHARRILDDRLDDPPTAAELADLVGWPAKRLARVFTARYGMPPGQYRLHAAMERAGDLLRATALPMADIAERLGYADVRFFIRQFGKVHGVPPATWRRQRE